MPIFSSIFRIMCAIANSGSDELQDVAEAFVCAHPFPLSRMTWTWTDAQGARTFLLLLALCSRVACIRPLSLELLFVHCLCCVVVALVATTSALGVLLDLQPTSALNTQGKRAQGTPRLSRAVSEAMSTARHFKPTCDKARCQTTAGKSCALFTPCVGQQNLISSHGAERQERLSTRA